MIVEKWFWKTYYNEGFIGKVKLKQTAKQLRYAEQDRTYVVGSMGTKESVHSLLNYHTIFDLNDERFTDTYQEAFLRLRNAADSDLQAAKREVKKAETLQDSLMRYEK